MGYHESDAEIETTGMTPAPYLRVNRSASLTLSTTWQRIDFNGTSTRNTDTFPVMSNGHQLVEWNSTDKVFNFFNTTNKHYDVIFNFHVNSVSLLSLTNLTPATIRLRFVVPSPTPRYFPLPDDGPFVDIGYTSLSPDVRGTYNYIIRSVSDVWQYGIGLDMQLSATPLGTITLSSTDMSLYGR